MAAYRGVFRAWKSKGAFFAKVLDGFKLQIFSQKKLYRRYVTGLKIGFWLMIWNTGFTLVASLKIKPKKYWARKYVWPFFEKAKSHCTTVNRRSVCLCRSSRPKGSLKKMSWEISQNSPEEICAESLFWCIFCEFCETCNITFFAEQRWTTASEYSGINSSEGVIVLVKETVNYDIKTKAYVLICARSAIY